MGFKNSKVAIVGVGNVGATTAYTIVNQGLCEEIVLIDVNKDKAYAEALDMQHSIYFMNRNIQVKAGDYSDCTDADIVIITASAPMPKDSHDRLKMLEPSMKIMKSIVGSVMKSGFNGIFVVVSNPVDIMTYYVWRLSGLPKNRVIGSGTTLDTARICCELSEMYDLDAKSVEAFVCGEHGDSEFVPWSQAMMSTKPIFDLCSETEGCHFQELLEVEEEVRMAAYKIIEAKRATYYGIGMAMARITKAILGNEHSVLTVSALLRGEYGEKDVFIGIPCVVNRMGIGRIIELNLGSEEKKRLHMSCETLEKTYRELG